ncbi:unnamed protein product, partial [Prorocentrum cordatum]
MYDYGLVGRGFPDVTLSPDLSVPWKTHCGVHISVMAARTQRWYRQLVLPQPLPSRERPCAAADPDSKTSKRKAAARERKVQQLPSDMQDLFGDFFGPMEGPDGMTSFGGPQSTHCSPPRPAGPSGVEGTDSGGSRSDVGSEVAFAIAAETWDEAMTQIYWEGVPEPHGQAPSGFLGHHAPYDPARHFAFRWQARGRVRVDALHNHWVTVMERAVLLHEKVDSDKWKQYSGRARGPACCWKLVRSTPGRAHMRNEQAEWWGLVSTLVTRYVALVRNASDPHQAAQCVVKARQLIEQLDGKSDELYFGKKQDPQEVFVWKGMVLSLDLVDAAALPELLERTRRWADLSNARAMMASRSAFMNWVQEIWSAKPGAVHRHVKPAEAPVWESKDSWGTVTSDNQAMLQGLAKEWQAMWTDPVDSPEDVLAMMQKCFDAAREDPLPAITLLDLDAVLPRIPARKAKGVDSLSPLDIQRLPDAARQAFVDNLNAIEAAGAGLQIGFPPIILLLEVGLYSFPRLLKKGQMITEAVEVTRSIVAGSGLGVPLAKVMLHRLLEKVHREVPPAGLWSYIDDIVGRAEGTKQKVIRDLEATADVMSGGLRELRLQISTKTKLVASSDDLGAELEKRLRRKGIPVEFVRATVDLGSDAAAARVRASARMMKRRAQARLRQRKVMKVRRLAKLRFVTKKLWSSGVYPASVFGHQLMGTPPTTLLAMRRDAAAAVAGAKRGRCLTTVLQAIYGTAEPGVDLRRQLLREWVALWLTQPGLHPRICKVWPMVLARLKRGKAVCWKDVRGPIAALQATLLQVGWDPQSPLVWSRPLADGTIDDWIFPSFGDEQFGTAVLAHFDDMLGAFMDDCVAQQWQSAAHHAAGDDLAGGADLTTVSIELNRFAKRLQFDEWSADVAVVSGGQWPRERQLAAGYACPLLCPRCKEMPETLAHRIWTCSANCGHEDFSKTDFLVPQALASLDAQPALWLRGVPSKDLVVPKFVESSEAAQK